MLDVAGLPEPKYIDTDFEQILSDNLDLFEQHYGSRPASGTKDYDFLAIIAYRENLIRIAINDAARQNLLAFARAEKLDYIGQQVGVTRLQESKATTVIKFVFTASLPEPVTIPAGTEVGDTDDTVVFQTTGQASAAIGAESIEVAAECSLPGVEGNGWAPGSIDTLISPLAYVETVENTEESTGGANREADDPYRDRIHLSPERFSTAGPEGAYIYWAKTAHPDIADVSVRSPYPGRVVVVPLLSGGVVPGTPVLDLVRDTLSARDRRPITDTVVVEPPEQITYQIAIRVWVEAASQHIADDVVNGVQGAMEQYAALVSASLGWNVVPEQIVAAAQRVSGVYRAICDTPEYIPVGRGEVAICTDINVQYEGVAS